jgi:ribosomal protein L11 methyltransferase
MPWYSLTLDLPAGDAELVEHLLHESGAAGLEVRDGTPPLLPNVRYPKAGEVIIVAYFDGKKAASQASKKVQTKHPALAPLLEAVEEKDWSNEWKHQIRPVQVGRLWVGPSWEKSNAPADKVQLVIEPKMAFGTGDHPTTSMCLRAVDEFMQAHPGASVLDVGTGTGVLALAAKRLGAKKVVATDNDPIAVELSKENAEVNKVKGVDFSTRPLQQLEGKFDLVVANILANTLIELAPQLVARAKSAVVLAGVLAPQRDEVTKAFVAEGLRALPGMTTGEWVRLDFERAK